MILVALMGALIMCIAIIFLWARNKLVNLLPYINQFLSRHCKDPAVLNTKDFEWTSDFRANWKVIRDEYLGYAISNTIPVYKTINEMTSSCDLTGGWRTLFLRIFGKDTKCAHFFPKTMQLINGCPCTLAFFSVFEPGTKLTRHVGLYKGVLRYHLPLIIPDKWDKCFINVNGRVLNWRFDSQDDPMDLMFDDTFLHHAENNTDQKRVILFLDIKRDFKSWWLNTFNTILLRFIRSNDAIDDTLKRANRSSHREYQ